jgi:hypothetical protein
MCGDWEHPGKQQLDRLLDIANRQRRLRKVPQRIEQGAPMIDSDATDLVAHAIECFRAGQPPFNPQVESLQQYFTNRIDNQLRSICKRLENNTFKTHFVSAEEESVWNVSILSAPTSPRAAVESADFLIRFRTWLSSQHSHLIALLDYRITNGLQDVDIEATALHVGPPRVHDLRRQLKAARRQFLQQKTA